MSADGSLLRVPFTRREWAITSNAFLSDEIGRLKTAAAILASWRSRSGKTMPVAPDISELLLCAIIADQEMQKQESVHEENAILQRNLRLSYCSVVIRFVNFVHEVALSQEETIREGIANNVSKYNVPKWLVNMRHDASHRRLPTMQQLRNCASFTRQWLWDNYWSLPIEEATRETTIRKRTRNTTAQGASGDDNDPDDGADADSGIRGQRRRTITQKLMSLLIEFENYRMNNMTDEDSGTDPNNILGRVDRHLKKNITQFVKVLVSGGHLIMDEYQLTAAGIGLNDENWQIMEAAQKFWSPIIGKLNSVVGAMPELLFQLIDRMGANRVVKSHEIWQLSAWSHLMLDSFTKGSPDWSESDWTRILKVMLPIRQHFTPETFDKIFNNLPSVLPAKKNQLKSLIEIPNSKEVANSLPLKPSGTARCLADDNIDEADIFDAVPVRKSQLSIKTVEDLIKEQHMADLGLPDDTVILDPFSGQPNWLPVDSADWSGLPLGLTPEQTTESLCLVMDEHGQLIMDDDNPSTDYHRVTDGIGHLELRYTTQKTIETTQKKRKRSMDVAQRILSPSPPVKKKRRIANSAETIETVRTGKQRALKEQETKITKMMAVQLDNSGGPRTVTMKSKTTSPDKKKPMKNSVEGKKTVNPPVTKKTAKMKKKTKKTRGIQSINTEEPEVIICE